MNAWYATLKRPPLTPPNWVFSPVWTALYVAIAVSIVLYYRAPRKPHVRLTATVLIAHLAANFAWTYLFFGLRSPGLALADIVLLDVSLGLLIRWFWKSRALAGALLVPYLAWVLFATYLNYGFYRLN
ncbi:MAG: tryptophan-rich sensory protein [Kiritimatiellae bacterium]|nr:tryptophan-rich sensory protein [Kiritimatiellia bacterium]